MSAWHEKVAFAAALAVFAFSFDGQPCFSSAPNASVSSSGSIVLQPRYVLLSIGGQFPPTKATAANGDSIRVYADTLYVDPAGLTYTQATRVGRFAGFAAESIKVEHVTGTVVRTGNLGNTITFPTLIGGAGTDTPSLGTDISLGVLPTGATVRTAWRYIAH